MSRRTWKRPADAKRGDRFRAGRRLWSAKEDAILRAEYADTPTPQLAARLRRTTIATSHRAINRLGLRKSPAFCASQASGRIRRHEHRGRQNWFPKGNVPANKGLRGRKGYGPGRMKETQFKKGQCSGKAAEHLMPIGSTRLVDGYLYRKVSDVMNVPYTVNWKPEHWLIWARKHGRVPRGHVLMFRNGNKADVRIKNLKLITRKALMARNTVHNLPKPVARAVLLLGALNRQIRKREQHAQHN